MPAEPFSEHSMVEGEWCDATSTWILPLLPCRRLLDVQAAGSTIAARMVKVNWRKA